ncbi:Wnt inhibitory factor 1 [Mactra antiquata]
MFGLIKVVFQYTYFFDDLQSKNTTILYNPLLSIPASGIIPKGPKIFQVSIPCTGKDEGVAHFVLGLEIYPHNHGKAMEIELELKKRCEKFETTDLCKMPCQNNGRCNQNGECECPQGYHGQFCEIGKYTLSSFPLKFKKKTSFPVLR